MAVDHKRATPAAGQQVMGQGIWAVSVEFPLPLSCFCSSSYSSIGSSREYGSSLVFVATRESVSSQTQSPEKQADWHSEASPPAVRPWDSGAWFCGRAQKNCPTLSPIIVHSCRSTRDSQLKGFRFNFAFSFDYNFQSLN